MFHCCDVRKAGWGGDFGGTNSGDSGGRWGLSTPGWCSGRTLGTHPSSGHSVGGRPCNDLIWVHGFRGFVVGKLLGVHCAGVDGAGGGSGGGTSSGQGSSGGSCTSSGGSASTSSGQGSSSFSSSSAGLCSGSTGFSSSGAGLGRVKSSGRRSNSSGGCSASSSGCSSSLRSSVGRQSSHARNNRRSRSWSHIVATSWIHRCSWCSICISSSSSRIDSKSNM